jgi:hypothetical protein
VDRRRGPEVKEWVDMTNKELRDAARHTLDVVVLNAIKHHNFISVAMLLHDEKVLRATRAAAPEPRPGRFVENFRVVEGSLRRLKRSLAITFQKNPISSNWGWTTRKVGIAAIRRNK